MELGTLFEPAPGPDSVAVVPDAAPRPETSRSALSLDDWLDLASRLALSTDRPEIVIEVVRRAGGLRRGAIWMDGERMRAEKAAQLTLKDEELRALRQVRDELARDVARRRELEASKQVVESAIRDQDLLLRARREAAETAQFENELQRIDEERDRALLDGQDPAEALANAQRVWDEQTPARTATIARLEADRTRLQQAAEESRSKLAQWTPPLMSKTVAGFLIWIGYGAIVATGAVVSRLLDGPDAWDPGTILEALRAFAGFVPDSPLLRFGVLWAMVIAGLGATVGVAIFCDRRMRLFDDEWAKKAAESKTIELSPAGITRRSYGRLLASVPFLFAAGTAASFLAAAPATSSASATFRTLLPSVAHTFIGTAIALLCTAAFLLYVIRIMERPAEPADPARRHPWELAALVVILLVAIVISVALPPGTETSWSWEAVREQARWGGWTLFMLLSSLTFAYGLIHHGLYKDLDKIEAGVEEIDRAIRRNLEPPSLARLRRQSLASARKTANQYADDRRRLERVARRYRAGRRLGLDIDLPALLSDMPLLSRLSPFRTPKRAEETFTVTESEVAEDILRVLRELYGWRWRYDEELKALAERITEMSVRASWEKIGELQRERASLLGEIAASLPADAARVGQDAVDEEELQIRIVAAIAAAQQVRPAFAAIAADATRSAALRGVQLIVPPPAAGH